MWKKHWIVKSEYNERSLDKTVNTETGEFYVKIREVFENCTSEGRGVFRCKQKATCVGTAASMQWAGDLRT